MLISCTNKLRFLDGCIAIGVIHLIVLLFPTRFDFFFGFDDHAFNYLSYDSVIALHRVILESVEDRINIVESGLRVLALLLGVCDL